MGQNPLHDTLLALARRLADDMLSAAARSATDELAHVRLTPLTRVPAERPRAPVASTGALDGHVAAMVAAVGAFPDGVRARELRALLGLGKRTFLRVVDAAITLRKVRRLGIKAGVRYVLV